MFPPFRWLLGALLALLVSGPVLHAMNYSVPYVRDGMPFSLDTWGYGATIGIIEVNNGDNAILTYSNAPERGLQTLYTVQDFSGFAPVTNDSAHGTLVAHILDNMFTYNSQTNIPYTALNLATDNITTWSLGMAPRASYYGALFGGTNTKAEFLSLNSSLDYLINSNHVQAINNSWGANVTNALYLNGMDDYALLMDEYTGYFGKTNDTTGAYRNVLMVMAAGNSSNLLGVPADAFNVLSVGALDVGNHTTTYIDDPTRSPIPSVAPFSAQRPLADGRCGVHVVAPGSWIAVIENFTVGTDTNGSLVLKDLQGVLGDGTSFAAPHVAGEAALLYGAPNHPLDNTEGLISVSPTTLKGSAWNTDHKLIKALIINSADKIAGLDSNGVAQAAWQPGLITVDLDSVTNSIHPLNYAVGAGEANAQEAYFSYYEVSNRFWDVNTLAAEGQTNYYVYGQSKFTNVNPYQPGLRLTATLVWDRHVDYVVDTDTNNGVLGSLLDTNLLSNLDLILQQETTPGIWVDIYRSISTLDNVEHIFLSELSATNSYRLDVIANSLGDPLGGEQYALVVSFLPVPEPSTIALTGAFALAALARRRWLRRRGHDAALNALVAPRTRTMARVVDAWHLPVSCAEPLPRAKRSPSVMGEIHDIYAAAPRQLAASAWCACRRRPE
jgi:hypothetical protein